MRTATSPKVVVSSLTALVVTLLTTYVVTDADPSAVEAVVAPLVAAAATFVAGWLKRDPARS